MSDKLVDVTVIKTKGSLKGKEYKIKIKDSQILGYLNNEPIVTQEVYNFINGWVRIPYDLRVDKLPGEYSDYEPGDIM